MAMKPIPISSEGRIDPKSKTNSSKTDFPSQSYGHLKFLQFAPRKTPANFSEGPVSSAKYGETAQIWRSAKYSASQTAVTLNDGSLSWIPCAEYSFFNFFFEKLKLLMLWTNSSFCHNFLIWRPFFEPFAAPESGEREISSCSTLNQF